MAAKKRVPKKTTSVAKKPKTASHSVVKHTTVRTTKKKAPAGVHVWREDVKGAHGLVSRDAAAYPAERKGAKWTYGKHPAIQARGKDNDPNRPKLFFDHRGVDVLGVFDIREGALVVYQSAHAAVHNYHITIGAALFEVNGMEWRETWRTELPIFEGDIPCIRGEDIEPIGATLVGDTIRVEWRSTKEHSAYEYTFPNPFAFLHTDGARGATLTRFDGNPIIAPDPSHSWEAEAVLNPAAVLIDDEVHMFYRAIGRGGRSVFGHATSKDGLHFTRYPDPAYVPGTRAEGKNIAKEKKYRIDLRCPTSGVDGAEDPRATVLEGSVHILYAAFNGYQQARVAHIATSVEAARQRELYWSWPTLLTAPPTHWGTGGKNAALLPGKIDGMYVIFHRIWPDICIDYTSSLDMREFRDDHTRWLEPKDRIRVRPAHWDSGKILVGAPPIETKDGWLLIYNAVSHQHNGGGYKIGAMLLDGNDPAKVLYRSLRPILDASAWYEETGHVPRVTYACGAVIKDGTLFVYYGSADNYVSIATAPIDPFLATLKKDKVEQHEIEEVKR